MTDITLWHNPRCSKSRAALALLRERGAKPTEIKYLETVPSAEEIMRVLAALDMKASEFIRAGEPAFKAQNLPADVSEDVLVQLMVDHPILIERPVIIAGEKAVIGRPPENALLLL